MANVNFKDIFPAEICMVQDKPFIFSNVRVDRESVPEGLHVYDVRDDCDGEFWEVQKFVFVNHWCTIIGKEEIALDENGQYWCPPDPENPECSSEGWFNGDQVESVEEYLKKY